MKWSHFYFLHLYAVLRSIPNKLGGLIGFGMALMILMVLVVVLNKTPINSFHLFDLMAWMFISVNLVLLWLGSQPVENPYIIMGQTLTLFYFVLLMMIVLMDFLLKMLYE